MTTSLGVGCDDGVVKRFWLFMSWVGATTLVSFVTFQALSAAQGQVNDRPLTPVVVASTFQEALESPPSSSSPTADTTLRTALSAEATPSSSAGSTLPDRSSESDGTSQQTSPVTVPGAAAAPVTTTTTVNSTATTGDTAGSSTSTTTTVGQSTTSVAAWTTTTIDSPGGSVTVSYRPGEVRYDAAVPTAGYALSIEETGPEVRVEFEHDDLPDYEIRARWNDGAFDSEINEKG